MALALLSTAPPYRAKKLQEWDACSGPPQTDYEAPTPASVKNDSAPAETSRAHLSVSDEADSTKPQKR